MLICTPQHFSAEADLVELPFSDHKKLLDSTGACRFIDFDLHTPLVKLSAIPSSQLILSYHNFQETPLDLEGILTRLKIKYPAAHSYKICCLANSTLDALRMLIFQQAHPETVSLCMGENGQITRILSRIVGAPLCYAPLSLKEATASGQIPLSELLSLYHFSKHTKSTPIFGVIGDPISQSPGAVYHNQKMQGQGVYVLLKIAEEELAPCITYLRQLPFAGLSVTAPHKEKILPLLDEVEREAQAMGAVNTVVIREGKWRGLNTDGEAAAQLLGNVHGKKIVILGAGGVARAIAYKLLQKGARVTILNRTASRAEQLARALGKGAKGGGVECLEGIYDICIHAASKPLNLSSWSLAPLHLQASWGDTPPLSEGQTVIPARALYEAQAELQRTAWGVG